MKALYLLSGEKLLLDESDRLRWIDAVSADAKEVGKADTSPPFAWIEVTDRENGGRWIVAPAPCGLKCRCAAEGYELDLPRPRVIDPAVTREKYVDALTDLLHVFDGDDTRLAEFQHEADNLSRLHYNEELAGTNEPVPVVREGAIA